MSSVTNLEYVQSLFNNLTITKDKLYIFYSSTAGAKKSSGKKKCAAPKKIGKDSKGLLLYKFNIMLHAITSIILHTISSNITVKGKTMKKRIGVLMNPRLMPAKPIQMPKEMPKPRLIEKRLIFVAFKVIFILLF